MNEAVPLQYARRTRRRHWRRALRIGVVAAVALTGFGISNTIQHRLKLLECNVQIGQINWAAVLSSPTLLGAAWRLSSGAPVAALNSMDVAPEVNVLTPLCYRDGRLDLQLSIKNTGPAALIIPPLAVQGEFPAHDTCHLTLAVIEPSSLLGPGVRVVAPGDRIVVPLRVPAPPTPSNAPLTVQLPGHQFQFMIHGGNPASGGHSYSAWQDIPPADVERRP